MKQYQFGILYAFHKYLFANRKIRQNGKNRTNKFVGINLFDAKPEFSFVVIGI